MSQIAELHGRGQLRFRLKNGFPRGGQVGLKFGNPFPRNGPWPLRLEMPLVRRGLGIGERGPDRRNGWRCRLLGAVALLVAGCDASAQTPVVGPLPTSVRYAFISRSSPRPLKIHIVSIDVRDPSLSFAVVAAKDPDGSGPAETILTAPKVLAAQSDALVAINTAAWSMLSDPVTGKAPGYVAGGKADIHGWVENAGQAISPPEAGFWSVWMDQQGKVSLGMVPTIGELRQRKIRARWAVSGFAGILQDGRILPAPSEVRHPRTAVGITKDGNTLVWLVVDGRQKGFSEGVSEEELARLLLEARCHHGINLDGGGSSSLWIRDANGRPGLINRPSDVIGPRPVPVMLVVKQSGERVIGEAGSPARP